MGSTQAIDENGDAGGNWTVVAFQYKKNEAGVSTNLIQGHMMPVAHFCPLDCGEKTSVCLPVSLSFYLQNFWSLHFRNSWSEKQLFFDHVFLNPSLLFVYFDRN